jgi:hypothetical protein
MTCSDSALVLELHVDDEERGRTGDVDDWSTMPSWQETVAAAMVLRNSGMRFNNRRLFPAEEEEIENLI